MFEIAKRLTGFCVLLSIAFVSLARGDTQVKWKCSTESTPWIDQPDLQAAAARFDEPGAAATVDSSKKYQEIEGWGGCFNERGWKAMEVLSDADRTDLMKSMFDPGEGLKLNLCRTPIGSSDYATELYSLDETPGDYDMAHFSIARDEQRLIPYIRSAMSLRSDLKVWGVPWSPPAWMKTSNALAGGNIKDDDRTMDALALYFVRYVQAYQAEGIPVYMVMPQNEPCYHTKYSSCVWTGQQLTDFIGKHLGPAFKENQLKCEIYLGTFPRSDKGKWDYPTVVAPLLDDPAGNAFVTGIGCQWGGDPVMRDTHRLHPEKKLMQTENECGKTNTNDWPFAIHQFNRAQTWFEAGANSSMIWNLVLDETGLSTAGWAQCSPIVIDQATKKVRYTPYYYCYRHFSSFVKPGAHRISITGSWTARLAFENPDGEIIIVTQNSTAADLSITLSVDGRTIRPTLPAQSFSTFSFPATAGN